MRYTTMTTDTSKTTVDAGALGELRTFARDNAKADKAKATAASHLIRAAIKGAAKFKGTVEAFYAEIRNDVNGIAASIGADRAEDGEKYLVPGSVRTPVSQVLRAIEHKIDLGTAEKPRKFGDIRKETTAAVAKKQEEEAAANPPVLTEEEQVKQRMVKSINDALAMIQKAEGPTLEAMGYETLRFSQAMAAILAKAGTTAAPAAPEAPEAPETQQMPDAGMAAPTVRQVAVTVKPARRVKGEARQQAA
jgi:hypothetical protein